MIVGCAQHDENEPIVRPVINAPETLYADFEQPTSRTYVENEKSLRWTNGDEISYFPSVAYNMQYRYNGETGSNNAAFTKITSDPITGTALARNYAVYPYNVQTSISDEGVISLILPAEQKYGVNSFGEGANTMVCATSGTTDAVLRFKNAGGYLKIKLYGDDVTVKSVTLEGNNNERIAGAATVTAAYNADPEITMSNSATTTVTIDCGEGVTLSNDSANPTAFWFVLPEVTFTGGFTITVTDVNGDTFEKSTSNSFTIDRNMIQPMKALNAVIESEEQSTTPADNEIWYTASEEVTPNVSISGGGFGANITSNVWNEVTGKGVITFDGNVTKVGNSAFTRRTALTSVTLPNGVTSISDYAFQNCTALSDIVIGNSVRYIGSQAFLGCKALAGITLPNSMATIGGEAFLQCGLKSIVLPEGLKTIRWSAFSQCDSLTSVTIPSTVTAIEEKAFAYCRYLTQVICQATTPPTLGTKVFYNTQAYIDVPDDSIDAYKKADGWKDYADKIQ